VLQPQTLANGALCILDFPVYTIRGNVHETQRKVSDQRLKAKTLVYLYVGAAPSYIFSDTVTLISRQMDCRGLMNALKSLGQMPAARFNLPSRFD
jgi:hypothetical protein